MSELPIKQTKLSDTIVAHFEQMIVDGRLRAGQKLPSERQLAQQFNVSRPSLREAIQKLEAKGVVERRQGGGTYVVNTVNEQLTQPLFELLAKHPESQFDLLEFRHALEGISSFYAALRGTKADLERIEESIKGIVQSQSAEINEQVDALVEFYHRIAEASHNVILVHVVQGMQELLAENIRQNLEIIGSRKELLEKLNQHRQQLVSAIVDGQPEQARDACHQHLTYIEQILLDLGKEQSRIQRSLRRS
ncbi:MULTISPECIES: pyruvate dehydrogenase complex transcriptional repressor PdhR [unclassified Idiomarina]|jgi:GntR family transcriptional repressor for pyruvate dehydrogenase complex|uniref:pyruvate dehydrogenase complex transcriptional repressor PdhR n=1 Tax=unclassified Idiomarina TaxID=2614829 RepID=UPI000AB1B934|nr:MULTISPECIES: pyruvate dehydrogenase complex transcriptional repressor PdhR [unclassified Idiomarina]MBF39367.1 pyruvate dehydrogenase complex transcriptional repressor PdhR [Idiomarinaceae bacterium]MCJ8316650.1 pyruvate dehydrogenase complex transcriptional repressor PdhR [Idiomarina sp.]NQZ16468.1 pyruvate dehydrogenase complex transcriptional repressor PdhR [Idiomarina sp.]|tara:strand:+ start:100020 stop:100766 length:747 start_codon:yes stop_codon:yes gene_type:complete